MFKDKILMSADKQKYDYSLDFMKGIAACAVVFLHNMPNFNIGSTYWIGQAVPIFLFITAYLTYGSFQRGKSITDYYSIKSIWKMFNRIFKPFLLMTVLQVVLFYLLVPTFSLKGALISGGIGPGSYYPWIYLQTWIALPIIIIIVDKVRIRYSFFLFLFVCIILEMLSNPTLFPSAIYRLSFTRYIFLLYLACVVCKVKLKINITVIILAIISLIYLTIVTYTNLDLKPFIYQTGWSGQAYPSAFYTVFVFLLLAILYKKYPESFISKLFIRFGGWSYELFLWQMFVFGFFSFDRFAVLGSKFQTIVFILTTSLLCFVPLYIYKQYIKDKLKKLI